MFSLDCNQQHPVIGDGKHEAYDQWLCCLMGFKLCNQTVEFFLLLLGQQQVLVLELPGEGEELEPIVITEYAEVRCMLQAYFVIRPLEISIEDVLLPPRPLLSQFMLLLHCEEEALDTAFELPKRCTALHIVSSGFALQQREEAESIEGCMVSAKVRGSLLIDHCMMDLVIRKVCVGYQLSEWFLWDWQGRPADVLKGGLEDVVPELAYLFGNDGYFDSTHFDYIDDFGLGCVKGRLRSEMVRKDEGQEGEGCDQMKLYDNSKYEPCDGLYL